MMKRLFSVSTKHGLPPGTMVYTGRQKSEPMRITVIDYDAENIVEKSDVPPDDCTLLKESQTVSWINIDGLNDVAVIDRIGTGFGIHALVLEDILHTMEKDKISLPENVESLKKELAKHYKNDSFLNCQNMGGILRKSLEQVL